jgi:hypothetical protein
MTSTNVNPETEVKTETQSTESTEQTAEVKALLADTTVVADKRVMQLMTALDNVEIKVGGKWYDLIVHCKETGYTNTEDKAALKNGRAVILKSLLEMGKTVSSAYSIRSFIFKMAKPELAEALGKMKTGEVSVREARSLGRKPQTTPSLSDAERYRRAINDAIRFAVVLGLSPAKVGDDAQGAFNEYLAKEELKKNAKSIVAEAKVEATK